MENKPKVTEDTDEDGIPLSDPKACTSTKEAMDKCFYKWYSEKFLQKIKEPIPCQAEEANYNKCLKVILLK